MKKKKLVLKRESVATLSPRQLHRVNGGQACGCTCDCQPEGDISDISILVSRLVCPGGGGVNA